MTHLTATCLSFTPFHLSFPQYLLSLFSFVSPLFQQPSPIPQIHAVLIVRAVSRLCNQDRSQAALNFSCVRDAVLIYYLCLSAGGASVVSLTSDPIRVLSSSNLRNAFPPPGPPVSLFFNSHTGRNWNVFSKEVDKAVKAHAHQETKEAHDPVCLPLSLCGWERELLAWLQ